MTPTRFPDVVRGQAAPGLVVRGLSMQWPLSVMPLNDPRRHYVVTNPSDPAHNLSTVDWFAELSVYAGLHWLAERGPNCAWMLSVDYGGKVPPWGGLTSRDVSIILVARSVILVAQGRPPVSDLYYAENLTRKEAWSARHGGTVHWTEANRDRGTWGRLGPGGVYLPDLGADHV